MLRSGLTAAGLVIAAVVLVAGGRAEPARARHYCGAQDKQFVRAAQLSTTALSMLGQDVQAGDLSPRAALAETRSAELGLRDTDPRDPSLKLARTFMRGMIVEYGRAIHARWKGGDAASHLFRSYTLAHYAHDVLAQAEAPLGKAGCPVDGLLQE